jgi:hypothetical protein
LLKPVNFGVVTAVVNYVLEANSHRLGNSRPVLDPSMIVFCDFFEELLLQSVFESWHGCSHGRRRQSKVALESTIPFIHHSKATTISR